MANRKIKTDLRVEQKLLLPNETASRLPVIDSSGELVSSAVTETEAGHLSGVTSNLQTQLNDKASTTDLNNHMSDVSTHGVGEIVGTSETQTLTNKTINAASNTITDLTNSSISTSAAIAESKLALDYSTSSLNTAISNHLSDSSDAHDASAISNVPSGNLAATDVQAALNELQSDVDSRIPSSEKGAANGVASLDGSGKVPVSQLPSAVMTYEGVWNASTNSPSLADGVGDAGMVYRVGTAGSQDLGSGTISFAVGDYVIYNGSIWEKSDTTDAVASVFGRTGIVTAQSGDYSASQITNTPAGNIAATDVQAAINELDSEKFASADFNSTFDSRLATKTTSDLTEGSGLYFTDERAQDAIGSILLNTSTISFTYADVPGELSANVVLGSITNTELANDAVDGTKIADDAVNSEHIADDAILNNHIADNAVQTLQIQDSAVTGEKIADGVVDEGHLSATVAGPGITGGAGNQIAVDITNATAETSNDNADLILIHDDSANALRKMTRANFLAGINTGSAGDIQETSASLSDNQASAANVTGLSFANATVRSFDAMVSIVRGSTYEVYKLMGIQKGASWDMSIESVGDDTGITFTITSAGQVQYTSTNTGSGATAKFRAITTTV